MGGLISLIGQFVLPLTLICSWHEIVLERVRSALFSSVFTLETPRNHYDTATDLGDCVEVIIRAASEASSGLGVHDCPSTANVLSSSTNQSYSHVRALLRSSPRSVLIGNGVSLCGANDLTSPCRVLIDDG